jgi:hypothetical protein
MLLGIDFSHYTRRRDRRGSGEIEGMRAFVTVKTNPRGTPNLCPITTTPTGHRLSSRPS